MAPGLRDQYRSVPSRRTLAFGLIAGAALSLAACSNVSQLWDGPGGPPQQQPPAGPPQAGSEIGTAGGVRVGLILPLSAGGNAGTVALSMKNAAEMALAEFNSPNVQLLVKDDGGSPGGAQQAAQQALSEGAEIILGPLFAESVRAAGQTARQRGVPIIAFSTDAGAAASGVHLLSFLPESEVDRVIGYAIQQGKRSFAALIPENAYGTVVQAAFQQAVARGGGRVVVMERYPLDRTQIQGPVQRVGEAARQIDAIFIPDGADSISAVVQALSAAGVPRKQLIGTGLWEDPRLASDPGAQGGWFATPDPSGYRAFSGRYRQRYGQDPVRPATLAYDAVSLVAALVKTQGPARFSEETLTSASGFAGIDGVFRFRPDGTNQRGLAVMRVTSSGGQVVSPAPKVLGAGG